MELSLKTKITDLISRYPFIKEYLVGLSPEFKLLESPIMRKTLGRMATVGRAAMIGGVDASKLLDGIAAEIRKNTGEAVSVDYGAEAGDEREARIEVLKQIIRGLHEGADLEAQKKKFQELIKDVAPWEIAEMEQRLMAEGMPEAEIKNLCEVHVRVFKEALEKKAVPGLPAGHPVHTYMLENRAAEGIIKEAEGIGDPAKEKERLSDILERLSLIDRHYVRKENQLFPVLEANGISGPTKVMWALHDDIRGMLKDVRKRVSEGAATAMEVKALLHMVSDMIYKEEHILFPLALEALDEEDWAKVRQGEEEAGYSWVRPEAEWKPTVSAATGSFQQALLREKIGSLNLDTGQLTPEQVNLLLTHLPVDISFVNENDEVVYYSQTPERIFPRSPGIIGRRVQNCHPPKSVDTVERILREFKSGGKDSAEFWIRMKGRVLLIRYYAVRDSGGAYRGTIEVSQDITRIQGLQGEKRLLAWEEGS